MLLAIVLFSPMDVEWRSQMLQGVNVGYRRLVIIISCLETRTSLFALKGNRQYASTYPMLIAFVLLRAVAVDS